MRRRKPVLQAVLIVLVTALVGLAVLYLLIFHVFDPLSQVGKDLKIAVPRNSSVTEYSDSTGWFGDGEVNAEIVFPQGVNPEHIGLTDQNGWKALPMPKDLSILIFGNDFYQYGNDQIRKAKDVKSGLYFFLDRNEEDLRKKISPLQNRYSQNFTFAIYAPDTYTLYYYTSDS